MKWNSVPCSVEERQCSGHGSLTYSGKEKQIDAVLKELSKSMFQFS